MNYGLSLVTGPTLRPITLAEARAQCRLLNSSGEPAPGAPTVALAGLGAGNVNSGAHRYRVTFVTADGETDGGTISSAVTTTAGDGQVALTAIPTGGSQVTSRKIYRTAAAGTTYLLLATLSDNTTTTYADNIADASLGAAVPSTNTTEDPILADCIEAAREYAETFLSKRIITQTWDLTLDFFPSLCGAIRLPYPPLQSISSITYLDTNGTSTTLSSSLYTADIKSQPGRIYPAWGETWPATQDIQNAVTIRYVCGYGAATSSVPAKVRQAIKILTAHYYDERNPMITGTIISPVPLSVDSLLWAERLLEAA